MKQQTFTDPLTGQTHELTFEPNEYRASIGKYTIDGNAMALMDDVAHDEQEAGQANFKVFGPPPGEGGPLIHMPAAAHRQLIDVMDGSVLDATITPPEPEEGEAVDETEGAPS